MEEVWKDVVGYEGIYQVSSFGCLRSAKGKKMKPHISNNGYSRYTLCKIGTRSYQNVHRLVCIAFIQNPENKPCVNHIDGNKLNNFLENLEWCTYTENVVHGKRTGLIKNAPSLGMSERARPIFGMHIKTGERIDFDCVKSAALYLGKKHDDGAICKAAKGRAAHAYKYKWRYITPRENEPK